MSTVKAKNSITEVENKRLRAQISRCRYDNRELRAVRAELNQEVAEMRRSPWTYLPWRGYVS